jgi:anaerobic magnesium-protoporphyrin IX monomethyl ester cyclase
MNVLLLRPPRYLWPFNSDASAFWPPLGLLCVAAAVRRERPDVQVEVWDCPGNRWGWQTLERKLAAAHIDVLGIGEEAVSAHEALRAARLAKRLHPQCTVVAGGVYFPYAIEKTLGSGCVDVIVCGEGEDTFVELLGRIDDPDSWAAIPGIAFRDNAGQAVITPPRTLIADLDTLPWPAYDLIDLQRYGRGSRNHPALVSIEHSRGCVDSCGFCILWKHMGQSVNGNGDVRPQIRSKSATRSFDEVLWLYREYGRRTFGWVDPTFNALPAWSDEWAERMLASELVSPRGEPRTLHTAWLRADGIVRDEKLGILGKLVRAGLRQAVIGLERDDPTGLAALGKHHNDAEVCREAVAILREKYPQVYIIGTLIFGLPGDTWADLDRLMAWQDRLGPDYCLIIPLTPNPGTVVARTLGPLRGRGIDGDLAHYNFHTPVCATEALDLPALRGMYWRTLLRPSWRRVSWALRTTVLERDARKRRVSLSLLRHSTSIATECLLGTLLRSKSAQTSCYSRRPAWYDT